MQQQTAGAGFAQSGQRPQITAVLIGDLVTGRILQRGEPPIAVVVVGKDPIGGINTDCEAEHL